MRRILVRSTNWVGDAVMSLPALQALRHRLPDAHIAILARPGVSAIFAREGFADEIIPYTAARGAKDMAAKWALAQVLRSKRYDTAILLQNAFEAAALVRAAGIQRRIGYNRDGRAWLLTDAVPVPKAGEIPKHERFYYLELLRRAGILSELPPSESIRMSGFSESAATGCAVFAQLGWKSVVGISPGAAYGTAKRWLPERFVEAAAAFQSPVAVFGTSDEAVLCQSIAADLVRAGRQAKSFAGETSLAEFIDLVAACRLYLTNDSGGMHIASALGVPTVAIFGATDDTGTGPTGPFAQVVRHPVECSPCLLRECPIDHRCMTGVSAKRVVAAARHIMDGWP